MEGFVHTFKRRRLGIQEDWDSYWLSKTPEERVDAVGMINLTIKGEKYAKQKLSRICEITRRQKR